MAEDTRLFTPAQAAKTPPLGEAAAARDGDEFLSAWADGIREPSDPILKGRGTDLKFYDQVRLDPQVWSTLQQRRDAVASREWTVEPGDETPQAEAAAAELKDQLERLDLDAITRQMHWGLFYGYGVAEMMWGIEAGRATIADIKVRRARRFGFDIDGRLMLRPVLARRAELMPGRKFWTYSCGCDTGDEPYGFGLAHLLYWPVYFRRHGMKAWMIALDKYASPTAVGTYPPGAAKEEIDRLLAALLAIRQDSAITIPEGMSVEYLQTSKSAGADYDRFLATFDAWIAKIVLSQTMTTDDGSSRSQAEVHEDVADAVARSDADLICGSFNRGPGTWWTGWNYGPDVAPPVLKRIMDDPEDIDAAVTRDEALARIGWQPTGDRVREVYGEGYERAAPPPVPVPVATPDVPAPPALADADTPDAIAGFVARIMAEGTARAAANDLLAPVAALIDGETDLQALRDRLAGFSLADAALAPLHEHLARAAFAARIGGEVGAPLRDDVDLETP